MAMNVTATRPIPTMRTRRPDIWRGLTSMKAGVITPLAFIPMLREDRLRGRVTVQIRSEETVKVIVNPVRVRVEAHLIPKTVLERFAGSLEVLNRAYTGEPAPSGMGTTPKWYMQSAALPAGDTGVVLLDKLGIHWKDGERINTDLIESYNQLVNWQRSNVSPALPKRALDATDLAEAMWDAWRFDHVKPSFDAAQMEGSVPVGLDGTAPVIAKPGTTLANSGASAANLEVRQTSGKLISASSTGQTDPKGTLVADLRAATGASISWANMNLARQVQAFSVMRDRYKGIPDEFLVDLLMAGISVPDQQLRQPVLLARGEAVIGQTERYATNGDALDVSVANGVASLSMTLNTPAINTGGLVLVTASIVPEQLFERMFDPAIAYVAGDPSDTETPEYLEDYLDPQKVEVVPNKYVDVRHSTPDGAFGYAPLNYLWRRNYARVGGKFKRPVPDAFVEDRQRIWSIEKTDPSLGADWYLCPKPFPHSVFADTQVDPYEVIVIAESELIGNTVFGPMFEEDMGSYDKIIAEVDQSRLTGDGAGALALDDEGEAEVVEAQAEGSAQ